MLNKNDFNRLDHAIDKVLSDNLDVITEGRDELNVLNREGVFDDALLFWRGGPYARLYYETKESGNRDVVLLKKAVYDYKRLVAKGCYEHLHKQLSKWEEELKS